MSPIGSSVSRPAAAAADRVVGEVAADEGGHVDCGRDGADAADDEAGSGAAAAFDGDRSRGADDGVAEAGCSNLR